MTVSLLDRAFAMAVMFSRRVATMIVSEEREFGLDRIHSRSLATMFVSE